MHTRSRGGGIAPRAPRFGRRAGGAMVMALAVVTAIAVLGAGMLQLQSATTRRQVMSVDTKRAFYLAEAGLAEGIFGIRSGLSGTVGTAAEPAAFGEGLLWVEATDIGGGRIELVSTGMCGGGRVTLCQVVQHQEESFGALGVFGEQDVSVSGGSLLDSFDSRLGPYVPPDEGPPETLVGMRLGSNGHLFIEGSESNPTLVRGDVNPGPEGTVYIGSGVTITGATIPFPEPVQLPPITVPTLPSSGDLEHTRQTTVTLAPGERRYELLRVGGGARLVVLGPMTLVTGRFVLERNAQLEIDATEGEVEIYATEELAFQPGSSVSTVSEDATRVTVLVSAGEPDADAPELLEGMEDGLAPLDEDGLLGQEDTAVSVPLAASGSFYGVVYAPYATLFLASDFQLFGSAAARRLMLADTAQVHFDEALLDAVAGEEGPPRHVAWRIVELPDPVLASLRADPVVVLGLKGIKLPKPAKAHGDLMLDIEYVDLGGVKRKWKGLESAFDWDQVQSSTTIRRKEPRKRYEDDDDGDDGDGDD